MNMTSPTDAHCIIVRTVITWSDLDHARPDTLAEAKIMLCYCKEDYNTYQGDNMSYEETNDN